MREGMRMRDYLCFLLLVVLGDKFDQEIWETFKIFDQKGNRNSNEEWLRKDKIKRRDKELKVPNCCSKLSEIRLSGSLGDKNSANLTIFKRDLN